MEMIIGLLLQQLPGFIADMKERHALANPDAPVPTSEQIIAACEQIFLVSKLKDQLLRAALEAEIAAAIDAGQ